MAKAKQTYLLCVEGPAYTVPIKTFESEKGALQWAAENPPSEGDGIGEAAFRIVDDTNVQTEAFFKTLGFQANEKPKGYGLYRFENGTLVAFARIEPYASRHAVLTESGEAIDPEQTLDWS